MHGIIQQQRTQASPLRRLKLPFRDDQEGVGLHHGREDARTLGTSKAGFEPVAPLLDNSPQKMLQLWFQADRPGGGDRYAATKWQRVTHHLPDGGTGEQLESHHRADRVSREADPGHLSQKAEPYRCPRTHPELPEPQLSPQLLQNRSNVVVLTHAD